MNYKLTLSYDGTMYHGWQRQQNGITVQEVLENVLEDVFGKKTVVTGCSRTDAGVSAKMYVCNFFADTTIPAERLPFVLNTRLPQDISAYGCEIVSGSFNARFDTVKKVYEYKILNRTFPDPIKRNFVWHYPIALDIGKMEEAARVICGKHDFAAFCAAGSSAKTTVRNLMELSVKKDGDIITIRAAADGFLYNMVRIIAGTLVYAGDGKLTVREIAAFTNNKNRRLLGVTAPPQGLSLVEVCYE